MNCAPFFLAWQSWYCLANPEAPMKSPNLISLFRCAVAFCALALLPVSLQAGPPDKNPVVENLQRPFDWSGFYIGGNIGGVFSQYEFEGRGGDSENHLFSDVDIGQQAGGVFAG